MSIDDIQLDDYLCQKMFAKTLMDFTKPKSKEANTISQKVPIPSLGENERNILFLVNNDQNKFVNDDEMKLLSGLLTACKISMADIALVNYHHSPEINYKQLIDQFQSKKILIFGINAVDLDLPFTIPFFQIQKFQEQIYMISPSLEDFIDNVELKKELWNSLKKIFLIQK